MGGLLDALTHVAATFHGGDSDDTQPYDGDGTAAAIMQAEDLSAWEKSIRAMSQASPSHATSSQSFLPPRMDDGKLEAPPFKKLRPLEQKHEEPTPAKHIDSPRPNQFEKPILEHVAPPKLDKSEKPAPEQESKKPKSNPKSEKPVLEQVAPPKPNKSEKPSPEQQSEKPKSTPKSEKPVPEQVAPPKPNKAEKPSPEQQFEKPKSTPKSEKPVSEQVAPPKPFSADEMHLENFPLEARIIFL